MQQRAFFILKLLLMMALQIFTDRSLFADETCDVNANYSSPLPPFQTCIGPEGYTIKRSRKGGTKQRGSMQGASACFDYIQRNSFYWGAEGYYTTGKLKGHSGAGTQIKSRNIEWELEGRFGYTFQGECYPYYTLTPFAAYGYFEETNRFRKNFPIAVRFKNKFHYVAGGLLSSMFLMPCLNIGIEFKASYMTKGVHNVSNDPEYDHFSILMNNRFQYSINLPINYSLCASTRSYEVSLVPFYRYRCYGGRQGYPFDFFETKYNLIGAKLLFTYLY